MTARSAGVVVLRTTPRDCRCLLLRAYRYWDFPKGEAGGTESLLETARREVREETGITDLAFPWGKQYTETPPYGSPRKIARYYVARTEQREVQLGGNPELGRPEHHEWRWVDYEEARRLLGERVGAVLDWAWSVSDCPG